MISNFLPSVGTILGGRHRCGVGDGIVVLAVVQYLRDTGLSFGTRVANQLASLAVLSWLGKLFSSLQLTTWLFNNVATMMIFAIPVIFQPELRRALEEFSLDPLRTFFKAVPEYDIKRVINEVVRAVELLSANRTGALIVFEGKVGLKDLIQQSELC